VKSKFGELLDMKEEIITKTAKNNDIKQISAIFFGDNAVELDLLQKQLFRSNKTFSQKRQRDQAFAELAFNALQSCINQCKLNLSVKYPSYEDIVTFLSAQIHHQD
jgi:hypothetical protein